MCLKSHYGTDDTDFFSAERMILFLESKNETNVVD
jgi:hypothetical protein